MEFAIPASDPRPPCIGELTKGCSMGNTELLVGEMAQKIAVLKQRLHTAEAPSDHLTACKLDCLMTMLPLVLGGGAHAPQAPAMIQAPVDTSKIVKLEGDKATLKAENKVLEHQCDQLKKENKSLKEQLETKTTPETAPTMTFEEIAAGTFGAKPPAPEPSAPTPEAPVDTVPRHVLIECMDKLDIATQENARLEGLGDKEFAATQAKCQGDIDELQAEFDTLEQSHKECLNEISKAGLGALSTFTAPVTPPAAPLPVTEEEVVVMDDDPQLGQGNCVRLTDQQRTFRVRKWNVNPDKQGNKVKGTILRSVNVIVSSPLRIPQLDEVGSRASPVPVKDSLEIEQQFGGPVSRLRDVYQIMRPEIWTGENCGELQAQYVNDVKTMLTRLACQLVDALTRKAAANGVSDQVNTQIPDPLKAPCDTTLLKRLDSLTPGTTPQDAGSAMVAALETLFQTWMTKVDATDASDTIVKGIFCPVLSKVDACTWPATVDETQALGAVWNKN